MCASGGSRSPIGDCGSGLRPEDCDDEVFASDEESGSRVRLHVDGIERDADDDHGQWFDLDFDDRHDDHVVGVHDIDDRGIVEHAEEVVLDEIGHASREGLVIVEARVEVDASAEDAAQSR